jgi:hypothetical protein
MQWTAGEGLNCITLLHAAKYCTVKPGVPHDEIFPIQISRPAEFAENGFTLKRDSLTRHLGSFFVLVRYA